MKIITWNVNGIRACSKKGFLEFFKREQPDLLCLQETKAHPEQLEDNLLKVEGWEAYWSSAVKRGYSGTVTYTNKRPQQVFSGIGIRKFDSEGRFVVLDLGKFLIYNVYFPNGASSEERHNFKQEFLIKFQRHLISKIKEGREIILVGDYNVAYRDEDVFDPKRLSKVSGFLPEEREWFLNFLKDGFTDAFIHFNSSAKDKYTWWSYRENARIANRGWRIDHICVTPGLVDKLKSCSIIDEQLGSDHCPVILEIEI